MTNDILQLATEYGYELDNEAHVLKLKSYIEVISSYSFLENVQFLKDIDVLPSATIRGTIYACLVGWWKRRLTNEDLSKVTGQAAKPAQTLREAGFIFEKGNPSSKRWTTKDNGNEYRKIVDYQPCDVMSTPNWNRLNENEQIIVKNVFNEDMLGKIPFAEAEFDHRIPESVRKRLGLAIIPLTRSSIEDGSWSNHYQLISRSLNGRKRSACETCQNGEDIPFLPCMRLIKDAYISKFDSSIPCINCPYHNYLQPLNPSLLSNLKEEVYVQSKRQSNLIEKLKKLDKKQIVL